MQLCCELKSKEVSQSFKRVVTKKDNIQTHGGMSQASADGEISRYLLLCEHCDGQLELLSRCELVPVMMSRYQPSAATTQRTG